MELELIHNDREILDNIVPYNAFYLSHSLGHSFLS